jgi:DNA-binding PadR family transcriptional regulator
MREYPTTAHDLLPLREPTFYILLSLANGKKHGYAILKDIEQLSEGNVRLSTGTLYEALARLLEQNLIERVPDAAGGNALQKVSAHPGKPRKGYQMTQFGKQVLEAETHRLRTLVTAAWGRLDQQNV